MAVEDCQAFARVVARFLTDVDVWLTPTLSTPPLAIGAIDELVHLYREWLNSSFF